MAEQTAAALAPSGLHGRELAVLTVLGLVARHPHADDRRRNVVELTSAATVVTRQEQLPAR